MELKRILKLKYNGVAKKSDFPADFESLEEKAKEFKPINENNQRYQFIEENTNREIRNQEDFNLMSEEYQNDKIVKISINIIDKPLEISEPNFSQSEISIRKAEDEIRYKCTNCPDYNLCEKCESNSEHIPSHVLLKIRRPIQDKNLNYKIKNFTYKNSVFNYSINEKTFIFSFSDKENDNLVRQISLTNSGFEEWQSGNVFKCLPDSELKGKDYKIEQGLNINETINIEIIFQDFKKDLNTFKDEYDVYYQMFNGNEEAFGNITHFKVIFKE